MKWLKRLLDMITLVPPAIISKPKQYQEEWQDKRYVYWNDYFPGPLIYFRPVLFFSALGHIGCKEEVGNTIPRDKEIQHTRGKNSFYVIQFSMIHTLISVGTNQYSTLQLPCPVSVHLIQIKGICSPNLSTFYDLHWYTFQFKLIYESPIIIIM